VFYCKYIREKDNLPKAGCRELFELCKQYFKDKFTFGRDQFYDILRANGLMLRRKRYKPRTTNSNHHYRLYDDLVNTTPKFTPYKNGMLIVSDITYVYTRDGFAYLSLITDAYSRYIVGYNLSKSLDAEGAVLALNEALKTYEKLKINTDGMIHHSDRGVQYACNRYTTLLKRHHIRISMTQTGDPLHNAMAERMNNTLKNSWLFNDGNLSFEEAAKEVERAIVMYNTARPHTALNMRTPHELLFGRGKNPLLASA
jgi:putative transposase